MADLEKILLVDDAALFLELEKSFLRGLGARVLTATEGHQAVELATRELPDVVVLDYRLPGIDGDEVCRRIKSAEATRHIPVVLVTSDSSEASRLKCSEAGADAILYKPIRRNQLRTTITDLIESRKPAPARALRKRVLLLERSPFYATVLNDILRLKGYEVSIATSENEARRGIAQAVPDLILLDLLPASEETLKFVRDVRSNNDLRHTYVAALTSLSRSDRIAAEAVGLGVREFIAKTLPPLDIGYRIDEILYADQSDTRRAARFTVRTPLEFKVEDLWLVGETVNVSETGVGVKAVDLPPVGSQIVLRFAFPLQNKPFEEQGEVVWVRYSESRDRVAGWGLDSGFGIRFETRSEEFKEGLNEYTKRYDLE